MMITKTQANRNKQLTLPGIFSLKLIKSFLLVFFLSFVVNTVSAQTTVTAMQSGLWNDPTTWLDGVVPTAADDVIIGMDFNTSLTCTVEVTTAGAVCKTLLIGDANYSGAIKFSGTSSLTVSGDITLGDITLGSSGKIDLGALGTNATLTCSSIIESDPVAGSGLYSTVYGTLVFTGSFTLPINLSSMTNLVINGGTVVIPVGGFNLSIGGDLTVGAGSVFDLSSRTANRDNIGGTMTIGTGATLRIGGSGTIPANFITHVVSGSSTIDFYGLTQSVVALNSSQNYGNIIISSTSLTAFTKSTTGNIGIVGNLSVNSGVFDINTFTADRTTVGGNLSIADGGILRVRGAGTFPANFTTHVIGTTSTVEYTGTDSQLVAVLNSGQHYGNLTVSNSVKTLNGNVTVENTLGFGGTSSLVVGSNTLTLNGPVASIGLTRYITGSASSNLILNGAFSRSLAFDPTTSGVSNSLRNFTLNHPANVSSLLTDLVVNNDITLTNGKLSIGSKTLTVKGNIINTVSGGITGGVISKLIFNSSSVSPTLSMDQTTPGTTNNLFTLLINSSGQVVSMDNDLQISGTTTFTTGKLAINGRTLTLKGNIVNTVNGGIRSSNTSNLIMSGTSTSSTLSFDQTTPGTTNVINNVTINRSGQTVTLGNALRLLGTHTPTAGVFASGGNYTIGSTVTQTASVAAGSTSGGYITGNVTVERYIPANGFRSWRLLSVPTGGTQKIRDAWQEGATNTNPRDNNLPGYGTQITFKSTNLVTAVAAGFDSITNNTAFQFYNNSTYAFTNILDTKNSNIATTSGYFLYVRGERTKGVTGLVTDESATTLRTTGTVYQGDLAATSIAADKYAVIGNVYPSRINFSSLPRTGGVDNAFYVWDSKVHSGNSLGIYQVFSGTNGYLCPIGGGSYTVGVANTNIESGQAFFVHTTGSTGTISLTEANKVGLGNTLGLRPVTPASQLVKIDSRLYSLATAGTTIADANVVVFNNIYSNNIDGDDSYKFSNAGENFGVKKAGSTLVIEGRQALGTKDTIFFNMWNMQKQAYKLEFEPMNLGNFGYIALLQDSYLNTETPVDLSAITAVNFTVDANAGSSVANRFRIVFTPGTPLPVNFLGIAANLAGSGVKVDWKVADEVGLRNYEVERSTDGRNFAMAASVKATGNSTIHDYSWTDLNVPAGVLFYRIKSTSVSGEFKYSTIVKVSRGNEREGIVISPNPVDGGIINLQFNNKAQGNYAIRMSNVSGQSIFTNVTNHTGGNGNHILSIPAGLKKGTYLLEITAPDKTKTVQRILYHIN